MPFGRITFRDVKNQTACFNMSDVSALSVVQAVRDVVNSRSNAVPVLEEIGEQINAAVAPTTGKFDSVEIKAELKFLNTTTGKPVTLTIPAPVEGLFTGVNLVGTRVDPTQGAAIATAINAAVASLTLAFVRGKFKAARMFKKV